MYQSYCPRAPGIKYTVVPLGKQDIINFWNSHILSSGQIKSILKVSSNYCIHGECTNASQSLLRERERATKRERKTESVFFQWEQSAACSFISVQPGPSQRWCNVMNIETGCLVVGRRSSQHPFCLPITTTLQHPTKTTREGKKFSLSFMISTW